MISESLIEKYGYNTPIFADEILALFSMYSKQYVYRLIKEEEATHQISKIGTGVYYIPKMTSVGLSTITADDIVMKRYITSNGDHYGIYSGITLQNAFYVTTQMAATIEIVTNNEASKCREIEIDGRSFILRRPKVKITNENYKIYTILQLLSEPNGLSDELPQRAISKICEYLKENNITREQLLEMARVFPGRCIRNLLYNGLV